MVHTKDNKTEIGLTMLVGRSFLGFGKRQDRFSFPLYLIHHLFPLLFLVEVGTLKNIVVLNIVSAHKQYIDNWLLKIKQGKGKGKGVSKRTFHSHQRIKC